MLASLALQADDVRTGCTRVTVSEAPDLAPAWREAAQRLREQLASLEPTECISLALEISPDASAAKVVAVRPDGLRAERRVPRPSSLGAIVLGLVASLPTPSEADAATFDASEPPPVREAADTPRVDAATLPAPLATTSPPPPVLLDVGLAGGARFGAPTLLLMVDTELRIDVLVRKWLLMAAFRYAPTGLSLGPIDIAYEEFSLALGLGRRAMLGRVALDVALSPTLSFTTMDNDAVSGAGTQFRLGASARWLIPFTSSLGLSLTLDGEIAPSHLTKPLRVDPALPPLPSWTLGLRLGVVGQLLE